MPIPVSARTAAPVTLIHLGAALLALGFAVSLASSPEPAAGVPWALQGWLGASATWAAWSWGSRRDARRGRVSGRDAVVARSLAVERGMLVLGYALVLVLLLVTEWPAYKLPALTSAYRALPSLLPHLPDWADSGFSPNQTGGILAAICAFAVCLLLPLVTRGERNPGSRLLSGGAAGLAVLAGAVVVLSGSRAALAALVLAVLAAALIWDRRSAWAIAAAAAVGLAVVVVRPSLPTEFLTRLLREEPVQAKLLARADIWASALRGIADHPFSGIGLGTLNDVLPHRYPYGSVGLAYSVSQAHNTVLDTALTMGLPAAFGLVCLVAGVIWTGGAIRHERTHASSVILGLTSTMIVFVVFGMTDALSFSSASSLLLWVAVSGILYTGYLQQWSTPDV